MWETEAFPCSPAAKKQRAHGRRLAHTDSGNGRRDIGHCVIYCEAGGDRTAGSIDVKIDGFLRGVGFEK